MTSIFTLSTPLENKLCETKSILIFSLYLAKCLTHKTHSLNIFNKLMLPDGINLVCALVSAAPSHYHSS